MSDRGSAPPWIVLALGAVVGVVAAVAVVVLAGDDDPVSPGATAPVATTALGTAPATSPGTTPASLPPTTTSPAAVSTTTATPVGRCDGLSGMTLPEGVELSGAQGNFDGPPEPESVMHADAAFVFQSGGEWYLGFSLYSGYVVFEPLEVDGPPGFAPEVLVWDFVGDDGALVKLGFSMLSGAETYVWYYLDDQCLIEDAGTAETPRLELLDWFGANHTEALSCTPDGVYRNAAAATSGGMWEVSSTFYYWTAPAGPGFTFGFADAVEVPAGDPLVDAAGTVGC